MVGYITWFLFLFRCVCCIFFALCVLVCPEQIHSRYIPLSYMCIACHPHSHWKIRVSLVDLLNVSQILYDNTTDRGISFILHYTSSFCCCCCRCCRRPNYIYMKAQYFVCIYVYSSGYILNVPTYILYMHGVDLSRLTIILWHYFYFLLLPLEKIHITRLENTI